MKNEYDITKNMLNKIRNVINDQNNKKSFNINEQVENGSNSEYNDVNVINNVDINSHASDSMDVNISEEEKNKISQMIDEFRVQISSIVEFNNIDIYDNGVKLSGKLNNNIVFLFSAGDDEGVYITNPSMLKIDDDSILTLNKLKKFQSNYLAVMNEILINRKQN